MKNDTNEKKKRYYNIWHAIKNMIYVVTTYVFLNK